MIKIDNIHNLPSTIKEILEENKYGLIEEINSEFAYLTSENRKSLHYSSVIRQDVSSKIRNILIKGQFRAFHCTKIVSKNEILTTGLSVLNTSELKERLDKNLNSILSIKQKNILNECFDNYKDGNYGLRENMIWFVSSLDLANSLGCQNFFKYYGGEVTRRILQDFQEEFFPLLELIGFPAIIECKLNFKDIPDYKLENLIEAIFYSISENKNKIDWEVYMKNNIKPSDIIQIHER